MIEFAPLNHEKEGLIGLNTLELVQRFLEVNPCIKTLHIRPYTRPAIDEEIYPVDRSIFMNLNSELVLKWAREIGGEYNVAIDSNVDMENGDRMQFGMIDLMIPVGDANLGVAKEKFRERILPKFGGGLFLDSGKSYHYLGEKLIKPTMWPEFMGEALLTPVIINENGTNKIKQRVVDNLYIGHALVRGKSGLRITTSSRKPQLPRVVGYI